MRVAVTGSSGYIGSRLAAKLIDEGHEVYPVDIDDDIMTGDCLDRIEMWNPEVLYHLAAHKYAGRGEVDPFGTVALNVYGTQRIVGLGFPVVLASTCKAGDAVTCYGASKLIAERVVLNAGGRVLRLVNVIGSTGSVAEIWEGIAADDPLPVADCSRMWISAEEAVNALILTSRMPSGRKYIPRGERLTVAELGERLYPGREQESMPLRIGDRKREPTCSREEYLVPATRTLAEIRNHWDGLDA